MKKEDVASPINNTLIVDQLYIDIKNRILKGELAPDYKLSIRVLCEHYLVSDTPLKQALNRLVSEKLVVAYPRRGMRVKAFNAKEIDEATHAREMIELFAVDAAIEKAKSDPNFISALEDNIREDEKLLEEIKDLNVYSEETQKELEVSRDFHVLFVSALKNETILGIYNEIQSHRSLYFRLGIEKNEQARKSIKEHRAILEALKSRNKEAVNTAIKNHIAERRQVFTQIQTNP